MSLSLDKSLWKRVTFGDVVVNRNVTVKDPEALGIDRVIAMEHLDPGELRISRWGSIDDGTTFTRRVQPGQTLFGKRRAYQRKAAYAEFDAITSGDILVFEPDPDRLLPEFLPFIVQSDGFYNHALGTSAGSLSPRTNWRDLANFEFDLPPLDEQQRLANLPWAVERHRNSQMEVVNAAADARAIWLGQRIGDLLSEGSVPFEQVWERSPESGWSAAPLDEVTGRYVLSLAALGPNGYRSGQLKNVPDTSEVRSAQLRQGDLLVSRANTVEAVGRAGIFAEDRSDVSFPDTMMRLQLMPGFRPRFAEAVLASAHGRAHMRRTAAGSATSMVKINRQSLGRLAFPKVSVQAQDELLDELTGVSAGVTAAEDTATRLVALQRATIASIFGGDV